MPFKLLLKWLEVVLLHTFYRNFRSHPSSLVKIALIQLKTASNWLLRERDSKRHNKKHKVSHFCFESFQKAEFRTYFVYYHTFSYKIQQNWSACGPGWRSWRRHELAPKVFIRDKWVRFYFGFTTGFTWMIVRRRRMNFSGTTRRSEKVGLCQRLTLHIASWWAYVQVNLVQIVRVVLHIASWWVYVQVNLVQIVRVVLN